MPLRNLFDIHAAVATDDEDGLARRAIDRHRAVGLLRDVQPLFDQQRFYRFALRILAIGRHRRCQDLLGDAAPLRGIARHLDLAGLTAAAHEHLRFDDPLARVLFDELRDRVGRKRVLAARHGDAGTLEKLLALVLH